MCSLIKELLVLKFEGSTYSKYSKRTKNKELPRKRPQSRFLMKKGVNSGYQKWQKN